MTATGTSATGTSATDLPVDRATQRRNLRLGLIIGGLCLVQMIVFIILFTRNGLPKDPDVWKEIQAREAQQAAAADRHE
jgi:hypothetical protein